MAIKVFIKRYVPAEKEKELLPLLQRMRVLATEQPGYISGETLHRVDKPGEWLVISSWHFMENWREWNLSKERNDIQLEIDMILGKKTEYEIYSN